MYFLLILILIAISFTIGLAIVVFSFFVKSKIAPIVCVLTFLGFAIFIGNWTFNSFGEPEWNPNIANDSEITGIWSDWNHRVDLEPNHQFTRTEYGRTDSGTWSRDDWNLYMRGADQTTATWRFVQYRGSFRILTNPPGDPDNWDGDHGMSRN